MILVKTTCFIIQYPRKKSGKKPNECIFDKSSLLTGFKTQNRQGKAVKTFSPHNSDVNIVRIWIYVRKESFWQMSIFRILPKSCRCVLALKMYY